MSEEIQIPATWCRVRLQDVASLINGDRGKNYPSKKAFVTEGIPFINAGHLQDGSIDLSEMNYISRDHFNRLGGGKVKQGDVLYCLRGSLGKSALVSSLSSGAIASSLVIVRPYNAMDSKYLYYFLISPSGHSEIQKYDNGTAQPNLSAKSVKSYCIPKPPSGEQRRIVAKIEELFSDLDAGVAALERVKANLKRYRASVLKAAVEGRLTERWRAEHPNAEPADQLLERILTERRQKWEADQLAKYEAKGKKPPKGWKGKYKEPAKPDTSKLPRLPDGWCWVRCEQLSTCVTVGHVGSMKEQYVSTGIRFLRGQNVRPNRFDPNGLKYISDAFHRKLSKSALSAGDLLIVRSGNVGTACVLPELGDDANCSDLVIVKQPIMVAGKFLAYYMNSVAQGRVKAAQVGSALIHFNVKSMVDLPIPLPPLNEQHAIVSEVEQRLSVIDESEQVIDINDKRSSRLRQSILKRAFEGKLVPQDPADETAEALLARIAEERAKAVPKKKPTRKKPGRKRKAKQTQGV